MNAHSLAFEFGLPLSVAAAALLLAAAGVLSWAFWWPRLRPLPPLVRRALTLLRVAALLLLLFLLLDPTLVTRAVRPGEDTVVLLFDDSRSLRIAGPDGVSRGDRLQKALAASRAAFEGKLRAAHHVASYRFGPAITRLANLKELTFDQTESDPLGALQAAQRDLAGAAISAVVLFSDGVPQGPAAALHPASALTPAVPVFTVGVDTEAPWRDLELRSVAVTRTHFDRSPLSLTAQVTAQGLRGRQAVVEALEGDRVVAAKPLAITSDTLETKILLEFVPQAKGWIAGQARVRLLDPTPAELAAAARTQAILEPERILENNARGFAIDNRDHAYRILYLSGRPNWENKFVHRALEGDAQLKMASLIRISRPNPKMEFHANGSIEANQLFAGFDESEVVAPRYDEAVFIRLGLGPSELATGYPSQTKDLYPYDLVIWGDIEADYFSVRQMELTRDFVAKRGGSFLMLGGPRAFSEGHYSGSLIEGMMPVVMRNTPAPLAIGTTETQKLFFRAQPTAEGFLAGVWALDRDAGRSQAAWRALPELFGVNEFALLRAGATPLARTAAADPKLDGQPLFAWQPYGLGRCAVMATGETWQWKLQQAPEDETHDRFWRQLIRSLVSPVPAPVVLRGGAPDPTVGHPVRLEFLVRDALFEKREGLNTTVQIRRPSQPPQDLPAEESIAEAGVYAADFTPEAAGLHPVTLTALSDKSEVVGSLEEALYVEPDLREYQHAQYNPQFLRSVAERTRGAFFTLAQLGEIPGRIPQSHFQTETRETNHLWRHPACYALLAVLFSIEWYLRRKHGQP